MTPSLAMRPTMVAMRTPRAAAATNRAVSLRVRAAPARRMNLGAGARGRRTLTTPRASTEETGLTKSQVRCVAIHPHVGTLVPDGTLSAQTALREWGLGGSCAYGANWSYIAAPNKPPLTAQRASISPACEKATAWIGRPVGAAVCLGRPVGCENAGLNHAAGNWIRHRGAREGPMQRPHMLNRIPAVYLCIDRALMTGHVCGVLHGVRGCMPPSVSETGQSHEIEVDVSLPQLVSGGTQLTHPIHPLRPACPPTTPLAIRLSPLRSRSFVPPRRACRTRWAVRTSARSSRRWTSARVRRSASWSWSRTAPSRTFSAPRRWGWGCWCALARSTRERERERGRPATTTFASCLHTRSHRADSRRHASQVTGFALDLDWVESHEELTMVRASLGVVGLAPANARVCSF
jgi:hypothetical protein